MPRLGGGQSVHTKEVRYCSNEQDGDFRHVFHLQEKELVPWEKLKELLYAYIVYPDYQPKANLSTH